MQQRSHRRGVDAAAHCRQHPRFAHLFADLRNSGIDKALHVPFRLGPGYLLGKVLQDLHAALCMHYFGVELDPVHLFVLVAYGCGLRVLGVGQHLKAVWDLVGSVAVAHPAVDAGSKALEKVGIVVYDQAGAAVLPACGPLDFAAKVVHQHLVAVADPQDGLAHAKYPLVRLGGVLGVDACRPAGEYYPLWVHLLQYFSRRVVGQKLAVDVCLPDAPAYQVAVLRSKVQNHYLV